jgi:hypothetical protein
MNKFRESLLSGKPPREPLLRQKGAPRRPPAETSPTATEPFEEEPSALGLDGQLIPRETSRTSNHRDADRHRLIQEEQATATWKGRDFRIELINLSGGGAMISAPFQPLLWDRIELSLGGCGVLECAVRWVKGGRLGLEFAHETRIDADPDVRSALLREVVRRSFPDVELAPSAPPEEPPSLAQPDAAPDDSRRDSQRHPLIWSGFIHFNHDSTPVRLRNISEVGTLVESSGAFPVGSELLLDLGDAGSVFSKVAWAHGDQCGLRFQAPFQIARLAQSKPQLTPDRWAKPDYLRDDSTESSPWAAQWNRLTLAELRTTLNR